MELRQLHYFLVTAKHESITRAAGELYMTQPALSASIRNLEKQLGVELFTRKGNRLVLNDNGMYLAERISKAEDIINEAVSGVQIEDTKRVNTINCILSVPLSASLLSVFLQKNPDITFRHGYPTSNLFSDANVDVELLASRVPLGGENLVSMGFERYVLILPPGHELAERAEVDLAQCRDMLFSFGENADSLVYVDAHEMCRRAGFIPKTILESQFSVEAVNTVESGIGCAIAGSFTWLAGRRSAVTSHSIAGCREGRYLYLRLCKGDKTTKATRAFVNYLLDCAIEYRLR